MEIPLHPPVRLHLPLGVPIRTHRIDAEFAHPVQRVLATAPIVYGVVVKTGPATKGETVVAEEEPVDAPRVVCARVVVAIVLLVVLRHQVVLG